MRKSEFKAFVQFIEFLASLKSKLLTVMDRLTAAADAASWTGHNLNKVIGNFSPLDFFQKIPCISKSAHNCCSYSNIVDCDMLPPLKSRIMKWGLPVQWLSCAKYLQATLACPAIVFARIRAFLLLCPDTDVFSFLLSAYAVSILLASSRILIAAFLSLSMTLPQSQR